MNITADNKTLLSQLLEVASNTKRISTILISKKNLSLISGKATNHFTNEFIFPITPDGDLFHWNYQITISKISKEVFMVKKILAKNHVKVYDSSMINSDNVIYLN